MTSRSIETLKTWLSDRLTQPLPGPAAQSRFAPLHRESGWDPHLLPSGARHAATLILIYPGPGGPAIVLTRRHEDLPLHAGQVSLPGGSIDEGESVHAAALREAEEEIGIGRSHVSLVGTLSTLWVGVSNFVIHPVVGVSDITPDFRAHPHEVRELLEVPLANLLSPARLAWAQIERRGRPIPYPYFDVSGHHVWGATAMVLGEFVCLFEPDHTPPPPPGLEHDER